MEQAMESREDEEESNKRLAVNTLGTTDEVDAISLEDGSESIHPAPAPTERDLINSTVDITSSHPSASDHQSAHSTDLSSLSSDADHGDILDASNGEQGEQLSSSVIDAVISQPETAENDGVADEFDSSDSANKASPLHRVLELPPALDLEDFGTVLPGDPTPPQSAEVYHVQPPHREADVDGSSSLDAGEQIRVAEEENTPAPLQPSQGLGTSTQAAADNQRQSADSQEQQTQAQPPVNAQPLPANSPKQPTFAYHHDDTDTTMAELEEFFSYVEVRGVVEEGRDAWARGWESMSTTEWPDVAPATKKSHLHHLLEELEHRDPEIRFEAARRIAYIAHGTPIYSTSPQHHLHLIIANCSLLREVGTLTAVQEALKNAGGRWNIISSIPESDGTGYGQSHSYYPSLSPQERQEYLEEINGELAIHLSILYFMVEVFRGDEVWADELMALDPPLPIYLLNLVAGLRERNAKGYPVKKLLLLLWKSLLACLGGSKDITRVKAFVREVEGLPDENTAEPLTKGAPLKATPLDFASFRADITNKYPTYDPPEILAPIPQIPMERIVAAAASAPLRSGFDIHSSTNFGHLPDSSQDQAPPAGPLPPTPAPTPPPSPPPMKPKKQQYQTDQTKPFLMPFSIANVGGGHYSSIKGKGRMHVPFSIDEAGKLYKKNIRITTELWQVWKLREEYLADETGVGKDGHVDGASADRDEGSRLSGLTRRFDGLSLDDDLIGSQYQREQSDKGSGGVQADPLAMLYQLEAQCRLQLKAHKLNSSPESSSPTHKKEEKRLAQRMSDVKRLQRIEIIYRATLPHLQSAVIVLLKLLLATVTANNNVNMNNSDNEIQPPLNLEDTDIMRHREITSKAVSAILILTLRWFKTSHAMKFHYLAHLLVDSNCLLLVLKMFGLQEVSNQVRMKNEVEEWNFFQFCHLYGSQNPAPGRPEDAMLRPRPQSSELQRANGETSSNEGEDPEVITNLSWRNFFSIINFVHVLQKLTKKKPHRILLLVQYKSSAILKRILKVTHPLLQLYALKVIKSQVPYCGRKWRQSNMKVITAIYLNCRPDLRDEWLTTIDIDNNLEDPLPHEQTLRTLVKFFNTKHYGGYAPHLYRHAPNHLGPNGLPIDSPGHPLGPAAGNPANGINILGGGAGVPGLQPPLASPGNAFQPSGPGGFFDSESFPPARPLSTFGGEDHFRTSYIPDSLMDGYLEDYEELLGDIFTPVYDANGMPYNVPGSSGYASPSHSPHSGVGLASPSHGPETGYLNASDQAWHRLGEILGDADSISDSESVGSIGFLDVGGDSEGSEMGSESESEAGRNDWEHLSPQLATALEEQQEEDERQERASPGRRKRSSSPSPRSPRLRRSSSSGTPRSPALRPVLVNVDNPDNGESAVDEVDEDDEEDEDELYERMLASPRRSPRATAIDEVEAFF